MLTLKSAIIFAVLGVVFMIKNPFHKSGFLRAQGVITDYERAQQGPNTVYFAKVKFPFKEEEILFTDITPRSKKPLFGKIVSVLYNSKKPQEAKIEGIFPIVFPWLFVLAAFIILVYNLRQTFIF